LKRHGLIVPRGTLAAGMLTGKRFRQPRGGTCWEPEPMNAKGLSTWISEVPPKVVAYPLQKWWHTPFWHKGPNTDRRFATGEK